VKRGVKSRIYGKLSRLRKVDERALSAASAIAIVIGSKVRSLKSKVPSGSAWRLAFRVSNGKKKSTNNGEHRRTG